MDFPLHRDIANYNVYQLAEWILECRNFFMQWQNENGFVLSGTEQEIEDYCKYWFHHYRLNEGIYNGYKYRRALHLLALPRIKYLIEFPNGHTLDATQSIFEILAVSDKDDSRSGRTYFYDIKQYAQHSDTIKKIVGGENRRVSNYEKNLNAFLSPNGVSPAKRLPSLITDFNTRKITTKLVTLNHEEQISDYSPEYILGIIRDGNVDKLRVEEEVLTAKTELTYTNYVAKELPKFHIDKNTYYSYVRQEKRRINKMFFTNLAFYLSLTLLEAEKMYKNEGFSIVNSYRGDDEIIKLCLRCGVPQQYASILLRRAGYQSLDICKKPSRKVPSSLPSIL